MKQILKTIISAVGAFGATNLDDIFILMLFFSQTNRGFTNVHVIIGQYLGIGVLVIISLIGALGVFIIPQHFMGLLGFIPLYMGLKQWLKNRRCDMEEKQQVSSPGNGDVSGYRSGIARVAAVTIANGGDNIGIYIPFFASQGKGQLQGTILLFIVLIGLWCLVGMKLIKHPKVARVIEKRGQQLVPIVFILIGIYIFLESGVFKKLLM